MQFFQKFLLTAVTVSVLLCHGLDVDPPSEKEPMEHEKCSTLKDTVRLNGTKVMDSTYVSGDSTISTHGPCQSAANVTSPVCRVQAVVQTSGSSEIRMEVWLPDQWSGRILGTGNLGLGGCIDYLNLDYGAHLQFASIGSNNGHDGNATDGSAFLNHPEVIQDFSYGSVHAEALLAKQLVEIYYNKKHSKAYYIGCDTGGRQAMISALMYPNDFDGLIGGAPAVDFNGLVGARTLWERYVGAPDPASSPSFLPAQLWKVVAEETLRQCDDLDGAKDGILGDPDLCMFRPETLLCSRTNPTGCLTTPQVVALRKIYEATYGTKGQFMHPRYDPMGDHEGPFEILNGKISEMAESWYRNAVYNDPGYSFKNFSIQDVEYAISLNASGVNTWNGNFTAFRNRGGKILTYHGRQDPEITSRNSLRYYNLVSTTLSLGNLDDFYRLFLIPGMGHCHGGPGATSFGQSGIWSNAVNSSSHNILWALVDWVENDHPPMELVGINPETKVERKHCRYPQTSIFDGKGYICKVIP